MTVEKLLLTKLICSSFLRMSIYSRLTVNFLKAFLGNKAGILLPKGLLKVTRLTKVELPCCFEPSCDCQNQCYLPVPSKSGLKNYKALTCSFYFC